MKSRQNQAMVNHALAAQPAKPSRSAPAQRSASAPKMGNQTAQWLLREGAIQAKLTMNQPGDRFEQEADRVAEDVMGMTGSGSAGAISVDRGAALSTVRRPCLNAEAQSGAIQTQQMCPRCEEGLHRRPMAQGEKKETTIQAKEMSGRIPAVSPKVQTQVHALRGSGQPLKESVRAFFEPRFGYDFSRVRVHTDTRATESAQAVKAKAFTFGNNIVFGAGQYAPETNEGKRLLAHELTHTVHQASAGAAQIQRTIGDGHDLTSPRFMGDPVLEAVFDDERLLQEGDTGPAVEKVQQALVDAGFPLPIFGVDGIFGPETKTAAQNYQAAHGLVMDGIVGPITMGSLDSQFAPAPMPPVPPVPPVPPAPPVPHPPAALDITGLTVVNQRTAIAFEEPGAGGPHFVTVAGSTGDEHVIIEATTNRSLNPGETIAWTFDSAGGGVVDAGNPLRALVSRRRATRVQVTATNGATSRSLTIWAIYAQVRTVSGPALAFSPPAPAPLGSVCGRPGDFCVVASVSFNAEIFPKSLITSASRPDFARPPVAPPGTTSSCGAAPAGGVNNRFDMSRQIHCAVVDPAGHLAPICAFTPRPFPSNNAEGNDDPDPYSQKNDPFAAGAIPINGRAVPAGFIGSFDVPSVGLPHLRGAAGDTVEIRLRFREFARLDYHRTWFLISNRLPWFATLRAQKNAAGLWVDNGSTAG